ncbi:MAG: NUDIX hydrolase [Ardenticatenaceae bacterium]|nr:NUDIX hydrolase [Ardenticatenaceae bacterium]MCB9444295.1 NUDIX hydrolase [Ardenticatenaceae bacterium]
MFETNRIVWQKDGSWRLRVETAVFPDNTSHQTAFIEHPGAVVLVPLREGPDGPELLMLRQYRRALDETILELPAGTRGWDENWLACAQRELREETGYRAETFTFLGEVWPAPGLSNELMRLYLAVGLQPDPLPQDADEEIEVAAMPLADLVVMTGDGRIRDAKSIIGILRAAQQPGF